MQPKLQLDLEVGALLKPDRTLGLTMAREMSPPRTLPGLLYTCYVSVGPEWKRREGGREGDLLVGNGGQVVLEERLSDEGGIRSHQAAM